MERGIERGEARGILRGREEGRLEGRLEGKLETALGMLREGIMLPLVAKCTGLTEIEILGLAENPENSGWWD
jgi:predicted transposase/invertase (TIGR01784 family)